MLQPLLSPAHSDGRTSRAPERQDAPQAASFAATFRKAAGTQAGRSDPAGNNRPQPRDNGSAGSGNRLPVADRPGEQQRTRTPTTGREPARTDNVSSVRLVTLENRGGESSRDAADTVKKIRLPEPLGDRLQLPVSEEVSAWLSGEGEASAIGDNDVLGQWLIDNSEAQALLRDQLLAMDAASANGLAVLVPVDAVPEDTLASLDTETLDPLEMSEWLNTTDVMVSGAQTTGQGNDHESVELVSAAAWLVARAGSAERGNGVGFERVTVPAGDWNTDGSLRAVNLPGEAKGAGIPAPTPMDTEAEKSDTMTPPGSLLKNSDGDGGQKTAPDGPPGERLMVLADALRQAPDSVDPSQRGLTANDAAGRDAALQRLTVAEQIRQHIERPLPANQGAAELTRQMGERVVMMIGQNLQEARMRLDPPDLGPMDIRIQTGQDQVQVQLSSQQPLVRDLLEQQAGRLRDLLNQQGFTDVDVDVSDQGAWGQADSETGDDSGGNGSSPGQDDGPGESGDDLAADARTTVGLVDQYV